MKIAHFISNFPINSNEVYGKPLAAYNLCLNLAKRGHEIHVFTISSTNIEEKAKISIHNNLIIHQYKPVMSYRSEGFSYEILKKSLSYDFDLVHIHSGISITVLAGYYYATKRQVPMVLTWHGAFIRGFGRYRGIIPGLAAFLYKVIFANKLLNIAKFIISPSKSYIKKSTFLGNYKNKVLVIPNGIDLNEFDISNSKEDSKEHLGYSGKTVILFVGSLYPHKGPQILLKSSSQVLKEKDNLLFVFMGGGNVEKYKKLAKKLDIENKVKFVGYIHGKAKIEYYNAADILVLPSIESFEIFGIVNLEAMASSTPIIASDIGGIPDLVKDGINGLLVQPRDQDSLSNAIVRLLNDEKLRKRMGSNGKKIVQNYSWQEIALETEKLYKDAMNE